ncbi:DUF4238 domain-containing protein [Pedobacter mucosus]|uniref:DUF4238 domain-containing protein n=1 Tax=Pedobacter mucosus TaxID=2895286 RepID=UPI001EE41AD7|nr:DUF4238 domain-containing protein [Pedobacter mucosus]UKT65456.1 DUF4238 domain-containing protein [Pedobacter mucosus]
MQESMVTEKKNQHYIPKFYLRNFSYQNMGRQIGVFNLASSFFFQTAPLKNQGSKNFFYGKDGIIEDGLSNIEGQLAQLIREILLDRNLPKKNSKEHFNLLLFVGLTHLRNPATIKNMKGMIEAMHGAFRSQNPNDDPSRFIPQLEHEAAIKMSLSNVSNIASNMLDLDFKLLVNRTPTPFISSDFPVVKYNQFLEAKKWTYGKTGYGNKGLQIIIPLSGELSIILFDSSIYKVGFRKRNHLEINELNDINQLNILQILNCLEISLKLTTPFRFKLTTCSAGN